MVAFPWCILLLGLTSANFAAHVDDTFHHPIEYTNAAALSENSVTVLSELDEEFWGSSAEDKRLESTVTLSTFGALLWTVLESIEVPVGNSTV
jgi:hypothetical protein